MPVSVGRISEPPLHELLYTIFLELQENFESGYQNNFHFSTYGNMNDHKYSNSGNLLRTEFFCRKFAPAPRNN
jgi:hypothetical protein